MRVLSKKALLYCQVFIGFPIKYAPESSGVTKLIFSPAAYWWGLTVGLLQLGFVCYELYMRSVGNLSALFPETQSYISLFALSLVNGSLLLMGVVLFANYSTKYPKFMEVCNILERFDHNLQLGTPEYWNTVNLPIIVLSATVSVIFHGTNLFLREDREIIARHTMVYIIMVFAYCGRIGLLIHFQQVAYGITQRIKLVNDRIRIEVLIRCFRRSILRQNPPCVDLRQDCVSRRKVVSLMSAYHLLCDAVHQANAFYGDLLLTYIFCSFIKVTEMLYFNLILITKEKNMAVYYLVTDFFFEATFVVLVALSSSGVSEAAGETAPLIRKLINQDLALELREELKYFLLQLANKTVEFSAGGFFQINRQTLTSMAAAVTTYLVIMIQFETQSN